MSCQNSDPYFDGPNTGVVRSYDFNVARGTVAPDGFSLETLLINGQYPGVCGFHVSANPSLSKPFCKASD